MLDKDPLTKDLTLIFTGNLDADMLHEVGHTLDPNRDNRGPKEAVLEEFAAYYRDTYVPNIYTTKTVQRDGSGKITREETSTNTIYDKLDNIKHTLSGDLYGKYQEAFGSPGAYVKQLEGITRVISQLECHMSKPLVNKCLYNARSLYEPNHLLDVITREKRGI